jgi:hypothetical protein
MHVAEFTLHAKPGHFEQVVEIYSEFVADFLNDHPALRTLLVLGDEASGVLRGVAVYTDREAADAVTATRSSPLSTTGSSRCWQAHPSGSSYSSCTTTRARRPLRPAGPGPPLPGHGAAGPGSGRPSGRKFTTS